MKNIFKILLSLTALAAIVYYYSMEIAVSSSSHNIAVSDRKGTVANVETAVIIGFVLLVMLWLPWKIIFKKRQS